jgi:molybdate transport system substrate-binding protein
MPVQSRPVLNHRSRLIVALSVLATLFLLAAGCGGGGGGDDESQTPDTGDSNNITVWAQQGIQSTIDGVVTRFERAEPDMNVEVVYGGPELEDRLLQGERPDIYISTGVNVQQNINDGLLPDDWFDFGKDTVVFVVPPGNPKAVATLDVFGLEPLTTSVLCEPNTSCGRGGRAVLAEAGVTAVPDLTVPSSKELLRAVSSASADAGLVHRTDAVAARKKGNIEYVGIPTASQVDVPYQVVIVRHGGAADRFTQFMQSSTSVQKLLADTGLAPLPGDPA